MKDQVDFMALVYNLVIQIKSLGDKVKLNSVEAKVVK